ncbi:hypothetical protein E2320_000011 [Naja naja]|nr:hypothetical protein E2320_000011 [Naja naja]
MEEKKKAPCQTMGIPKLQVPTPKEYLRKHSKEHKVPKSWYPMTSVLPDWMLLMMMLKMVPMRVICLFWHSPEVSSLLQGTRSVSDTQETNMAQAEDAIETPALGYPFQLGMLYDYRKDTLISVGAGRERSRCVTLWDYSSLQKDLTIKPHPKTATEIIASNSIDDKASALNISASLKASFLGGLIEVGGSAKYLHDTKKSKQQARVTVQYKTTTKYEQLTMSHLGIQNVSYPAVFEHGTATHVVTVILYGAQAFFVFNREVSSMEMVKNLEGNLQATLTKEISMRGKAEVKVTEEEKENALKFRCKFHGDFSLEKNPVTFQDAMQVYATLPKMLGEHEEKAVPMRVWLYPLTKLDTRAAKIVCEISVVWIFDAAKTLEELNKIEMQSNDLAKNPIRDTFPEIKQKIQEFKDLCQKHKQTFQKQLSIVEMQVISSQNEMEEIVLHPQNVYVVSFVLTSLQEEEAFLLSFQGWLQEQFLPESLKSTGSPPEVKKGLAWFEDKEWTRNARRAAKSIKDFFSINQSNKKVRFVVASLPDVDTPGASIYLYADGEQVSKNFELPSKPLPFLITEVRHDSIQLKFQPAEFGKAAISSYLVEYKMEGEENWKTVRTEDAREMFLLEDLSPNTEYQFHYAACCKVSLCKTSDLSPLMKTLPTSPPEKLTMVTAASSVISVTWMSPCIMAKELWSRSTSEELEVSTSMEEESADNITRQFLQESSLVEDRQPLVFALPLKKVPSGVSTSCLMYQLGEKNPEVPNKVILVMGATGCGKTTLINGMINHILGVHWEDNFRFKLIHETTQRSEAGSSTSEVTAYVVNHQKGFRIPYSLSIIDTPGFGSTRGADNIQLLITFADGGTPPVLEALKEADLPCAQDEMGTPLHFRFNYSALFASRENRGIPNAAAEMFWKMSTESMKDFFDSLRMLETKSITLILEVLKKHQELEAALTSPPPPKKSRLSCGATSLEMAGSIQDKDTAAEVSRGMKLCSPGPHVILHMMDPFCSSKKEMDMAQLIKEIFGLKAKNYIILLVTHKNYLEDKSVANFIYSRDENLKKYIAECGNWCLAFNNKAKGAEQEAQVAELMTMIDDLVERNRNAPCYTEDMMNVNYKHNF